MVHFPGIIYFSYGHCDIGPFHLFDQKSAAAWDVSARAAFGLLLGIASILAGVTWSGWKRRLGTKDSSALVPGLGGVMDMIDSLLLAGPAAVLFYVLHTQVS